MQPRSAVAPWLSRAPSAPGPASAGADRGPLPRSGLAFRLRHPADDLAHLVRREGPERLGPHIAKGAEAQAESGYGRIVRRLHNGGHVVLAQGPVDFLDGHPDLLADAADGLRPFRGILDGANPLVSKAPEHNVGRYATAPFQAIFSPPQRGVEPFTQHGLKQS